MNSLNIITNLTGFFYIRTDCVIETHKAASLTTEPRLQ